MSIYAFPVREQETSMQLVNIFFYGGVFIQWYCLHGIWKLCFNSIANDENYIFFYIWDIQWVYSYFLP